MPAERSYEAGLHEIELRLDGWAAGVYICTVSAGRDAGSRVFVVR
jgi:hypothetical protein